MLFFLRLVGRRGANHPRYFFRLFHLRREAKLLCHKSIEVWIVRSTGWHYNKRVQKEFIRWTCRVIARLRYFCAVRYKRATVDSSMGMTRRTECWNAEHRAKNRMAPGLY